MFISTALVDYELAVKRKMTNRSNLHKCIWECFPNQQGEKRSFLFRISEHTQGLEIIIVSTSIPNRPDWCPSDKWRSKMIKDDFFQNPAYKFAVFASPTKNVITDGKERKHSIYKLEELEAWIIRRGELGGFKVRPHTLHLHTEKKTTFIHGNHQLTFLFTNFSGELEVTDSNKFKKTFFQGMGRAKAFGAGLLVLFPITE